MTKTVEVLDALMGSGKTHAMITYMSKHQDTLTEIFNTKEDQ